MLFTLLGVSACFAEPTTDAPLPSNSGGSDAVGGATGVGGAGGKSSGGSGKSGGGKSSGGSGAEAGDTGFAGDFSASGGTDASGGSAGTGGTGDPVPTSFCNEVTAEPLPARISITSDDAPEPDPGGPQVLTLTRESLFQAFVKQDCGTSSCHGGKGDPRAEPPDAFQVTLDTFDQRPTLGDDALERILSSDPDTVMPPDTANGDGSTRDATNPVRVLGERLVAWQKAGFPDTFQLTLGSTPASSGDPYLLSPNLGQKLSNLGSCVPNTAAMLDPVSADNPFVDEMRLKDALFAGLETSDDLPDTLFETDLVSLDSVQLGLRRVFSYAPTYPLFSDHAGKMRYVRVPLGETIHYDESLRDFVIPDNTRFYKTFLKDVKDKDGAIGYRKMETRLIVVRQDEKLADGTFRTHALRATYAWDKNERMARRVKDPLRDGTAATDRLCSYVTDESEPRDPATNPISDQISEFCEYMTPAEVADPSSGKIRHYGIPSTERCDQCHMGSSSHSYILGFTPWQVDRRKAGEGGVYEDPKDDELTQLARFLDYGLISGIAPGQARLEESQGSRSPRNDYELTAQGYMLGNCAFCHNPNGFPVVQNPVLRAFELFPNETNGGIFQFSLERYSPRAKGGQSQSIRIPYISPTFGDVTLPESEYPVQKETILSTIPIIDPTEDPPDFDAKLGKFSFLGPWRSLIWRNVYTPFTYTEDKAIFVHMPRHVAGYDCRAQHIMAEWMLSIPNTPKPGGLPAEEGDQPVVEVSAKDPVFLREQAAYEAGRRLDDFARSVTGAWCPEDDDIVDPEVLLSPVDEDSGQKTIASPQDQGISGPRLVPGYQFPPHFDNVPDHAHWVQTDTTDVPGKWMPRRANWKDVIATRQVSVGEKLSRVVDDLQKIHLSPEFHAFALESLPMGLWLPACQSTPEAFASPVVAELRTSSGNAVSRRWLSSNVFDDDLSIDSTARVHFQSRGEAVFHQICQNCHGKDADSKSPLAATILELTGGQTRVANFLDGLFGPRTAPGAFARQEFLIDQGASPEDWQVRYMLFMGLGGTQATIPEPVLNLVATSPFYGQGVTAPGGQSPNMLESAVSLCGASLGIGRVLGAGTGPKVATIALLPFAKGTGHYETWESLCAFDNEPVVHVFRPDLQSNAGLLYRAKDDAGNWVYPTDQRVGDQDGHSELGIKPSNMLPWCLLRPKDENELNKVLTWGISVGLTETTLPFCPAELFAEALNAQVHRIAVGPDGAPQPDVPLGNQDFAERWTRRGAMNAGMSAYYYLNGVTSGEFTPAKPFDFCRQ